MRNASGSTPTTTPCSVSTVAPITAPSPRPTGSSPASCIQIRTRVTPRPRSASSRSPPPTTCSVTRRSGPSTTRCGASDRTPVGSRSTPPTCPVSVTCSGRCSAPAVAPAAPPGSVPDGGTTSRRGSPSSSPTPSGGSPPRCRSSATTAARPALVRGRPRAPGSEPVGSAAGAAWSMRTRDRSRSRPPAGPVVGAGAPSRSRVRPARRAVSRSASERCRCASHRVSPTVRPSVSKARGRPDATADPPATCSWRSRCSPTIASGERVTTSPSPCRSRSLISSSVPRWPCRPSTGRRGHRCSHPDGERRRADRTQRW